MRREFVDAVKGNQSAFGIQIPDAAVERLAVYFELVQKHNEFLHLVAPCSPEEFAVRHILESLTLFEHLPADAIFVDVGAGAGLPSIPCLIVRSDLRATLIESKEKKAKFLGSATDALGLSERAAIVNRQFEETVPGEANYVTCRALDKFTEKLPRLIKWSKARPLLFFGGRALGAEMQKLGIKITEKLMPLSDRRYLFISKF